jgi:PAS domain S-box-containing protein
MNLVLGLIAGVTAYAALSHLVIGTRGHRPRLHLALGAFAAAATLYTVCSIMIFTTEQVETARLWSRLQGTAAALISMAGVWLLREELGHLEGPRLERASRVLMRVEIAGLVIIGIASLLMPAGIFYGEIFGLERTDAWPGPISVPLGTPNPWQPLANLFFFGPLAYAAVRLPQMLRRGDRRVALQVVVALTLGVVPAVVDTFVLGVETFRLPITETSIALALLYLSAIVSADVARAARLKRELEASETRWRSLLDAAPEAVCVFDPARDGFVFVNRSAERLFGRSEAELLALPPAGLLPPEAIDGIRTRAGQPRGDGPDAEHVTVYDAQGQPVPCDLYLARLPDPSGPLVRVSLLDVRERQEEEERQTELEARLRRSEKLQTIGTLAEGIVHDFNNLLTPIVGYGALAAEELDAHPVKPYVDELRASSERARELVRQILAFRPDPDAVESTFPVQPVVKQALRFVRASIPPEIEVSATLKAPDARVSGHPAQLHQILMNLGLNAAHAMGEQGRIDVRMTAVRDRVELVVADDGTGMDEETRRRIFDPFFTTKGEGKGTGLGLAVVRTIIEGWSGTIEVDSVPGEGTTFRIALPTVTTPGSDARGDLPLRRGTERVLVIDDDPAVATVVQRLLVNLGYEAAAFASPHEALIAARQTRFDLCVTDFDMPWIDGHEVARRLRQIVSGMPVILMSGLAEGLERDPGTQGPWYALSKPFDRAELSAALDAVLAGRPGSGDAAPG